MERNKSIIIVIAVVVVLGAVVGIGGGLWWKSTHSATQVGEITSQNSESVTEASDDKVDDSPAPTESTALITESSDGQPEGAEPAAEQQESSAPEQEPTPVTEAESETETVAEAEPAAVNTMVVLYENDYYTLSLPADKVGYAKWLTGGSLDKYTKWDTFTYDAPDQHNLVGLTITTAFIDASSSDDSHFEHFVGRNSDGVYVYVMHAGGGYFGGTEYGYTITLK